MTLKDWIESCTFVMGRPLPGQPNITMNEEVARYFLVGNMCVAKWRLTKSIYRFNTTLLEELVHTDIRTIAEAPCSVFRCLPEPCVWVDMRGIRGIDGYFACVNGEELVLFVAKESRNSITFIPFNRTRIGAEILTNSDPQITAERDDCKFYEKPLPDDLIAVYASLLYLCSDSPDFGDRKPPIYTPPKRTKKAPAAPSVPIFAELTGTATGPDTDTSLSSGSSYTAGYRQFLLMLKMLILYR